MIVHMPGHKNSDGEEAPWVIKSHETGEILSSHKSKEDAEKHLYKDMQGHKKGSLEPVLTDIAKEVTVWYKMQDNMDKPELIDAAVKKFNLSPEDAEIIFNQAFPNGLKFVEKPNNIEKAKKRIYSNIEKVVANIKDFNITDDFIADLYQIVANKEDVDAITEKYKIKDDAFVLVLYSLLEELHDIISKK